MILVDAMYLNSPGGINLLQYLAKNLKDKGVATTYLVDDRTQKAFKDQTPGKVIFLASSLANRNKFYKKHSGDFTLVLCFSNIPPPFRLTVPVYTFFQNILLLHNSPEDTLSNRLRTFLKFLYIRQKRENTDHWIVQTSYVKEALVKQLKVREESVKVLPFFIGAEPGPHSIQKHKPNTFVYPATGFPYKNHRRLLNAWELLFDAGYNFELHLTIPGENTRLNALISSLRAKGLKITNHREISRDDLRLLYQECAFLVFPSLDESFGLPLVEAIHYKCNVIAADLPYVKEIIVPTATFDPYDPSALKHAVIFATSGNHRAGVSSIVIEDKIDQFVNLLSDPVGSK